MLSRTSEYGYGCVAVYLICDRMCFKRIFNESSGIYLSHLEDRIGVTMTKCVTVHSVKLQRF